MLTDPVPNETCRNKTQVTAPGDTKCNADLPCDPGTQTPELGVAILEIDKASSWHDELLFIANESFELSPGEHVKIEPGSGR